MSNVPVVILPYEKRTVFGPAGNGDLGHITDEIAAAISCNAGAIRLLNGTEGRSGGFGRTHIESHEGRMKQLQQIGYNSALNYVRFVAGGFHAIAIQADGRLVLLRRDASYSHQVICQWDEEMGIWSITTAIPMRRERDLDIVWGVAWE